MRIPIATYRLQFSPRFRFEDAERLVPYLRALGISDLYASPLFKARRGSEHGYDVTDHTRLNSELGRDGDLRRLAAALRERDMGLVLDVVPNHMGIAGDSNRYWQDVLENGPSSPYASFFDIDWEPPKADLANKVLLPILGDQYGRVLENGDLRLAYDRGTLWLQVYDRRLLLAPRTWTSILQPLLERLMTHIPSEDDRLVELESILTSLRNLPPRTETRPERLRERRREKEVVKRRLAALFESSPEVRTALDAVLEKLNGRKGDPRSFDALEALLSEQAYRLSYWQVASDEINYRRFFDVNDLGAIRVEAPEVFQRVHSLVFRWIEEQIVTGLRIDHPDGLYDPEQYFLDLKSVCECFVVAEKILCGEEELQPAWAVQGTTGYEALADLNGLFVDRSAQAAFEDLYARFTGSHVGIEDLLYECKQLILDVSMSSELHVLARRLDRISEQHRWSRDFTLSSLQTGLREVIACFPVYRTYIRSQTESVQEADRRHIEMAIRAAKRRNPSVSDSLFDFIASVLLLEDPEGVTEEDRQERREFVMRFQQITAPVMAKGVEDTAFYRFYPLASLNEVGGGPERFGTSIEDFHRRNAARAKHWPHSFVATSTHDTKRSEDVRARLAVLSEMPDEWQERLWRWHAWNHGRKSMIDGIEAPNANEEYFLYQTLAGTWPLEGPTPDYVQRIQEYIVKACKEAKQSTSWINPNAGHEDAARAFVRDILEPSPNNAFLSDIGVFGARIAPAGARNALAQLLLKTVAPGIPDFYQGTELWSFTLVDPDNRRPVDYDRRIAWLNELRDARDRDPVALAHRLTSNWQDGRIKMHLTATALQLRQRLRRVFLDGEYLPIEVRGPRQVHLVSLARCHEGTWVLAVVPRKTLQLSSDTFAIDPAVWDGTRLELPRQAPDAWTDAFTSRRFLTSRDGRSSSLPVTDLLADFPVALLEGTSG